MNETEIAPSATTEQPVAPATTAVAPSAPAVNPLVTLADYDVYAATAIRAQVEPPPVPAPEPAGQESPPAPTEAATETPSETPVEGEADEPLGPAGMRALQREREDNKQLRERLSALESKLNTQKTNGESAKDEAVVTTPDPVSVPRTDGAVLADCETFEAVDARARQAAAVETQVLRLQTALARNGKDSILPQLTKAGVKEINGAPLDAVSDEEVSDYLSSVYQGARLTQIEAAPRKMFLVKRAQTMEAALKIMPELADSKSERAQQVRAIINAAPELTQRADWPELVVKLVLGGEAWSGKTKTATIPPPATPQPKPAAAPAPSRQAPAAPKVSTAAVPSRSELDTISDKMAKGTATNQDLDRYAILSLNQR